jgi:Fe(3+) dicitrate transport protein
MNPPNVQRVRRASMLIGLLSTTLFVTGAAAEEGSGEDTSTLESPLEGSGAFWLPPIDVLAEPEELNRVGGSVQTLDEEHLEAMSFTDPHDVVAQVPGVYVRGEDAWGLRPNIGIRGAGPDRSRKITLTEDGILFGPAPYSAPAAYYFPLMTRVVGVEVLKGPAAITQGPQTIGGAVNFITRNVPDAADGFTGLLDLAAGPYLTRRGHLALGYGADWGGFLLDAGYLGSNGFKQLGGGGDTGFDRGEVVLRGRVSAWTGAIRHHVDTKVGWGIESSAETYLGLASVDFGSTPNLRYAASELDQMDWQRWQVQLAHTVEVPSGVQVRTTLYRHMLDRVWGKLNGIRGAPSLFDILLDPNDGVREVYFDVLTGAEDSTDSETLLWGENDRSYVSQGVQLDLRWQTTGLHIESDLEAGVRVHHDTIHRDHSEAAYDMRNGEMVARGTPTTVTADNQGSALAVAAWAAWHGRWNRLTLHPGIRTEWIQTALRDDLRDSDIENSQAVVLPGFGLHVDLVGGLGLIAGVHEGFSPIAPGQPESVRAERSTNYEGGLRWMRNEGQSHVEAIAFYDDYRNLVGDCTLSSGCDTAQLDRQFNAGEANIVGLEALVAHRVEVGSSLAFPLRATYTFTSARFATSFTSEDPILGVVEEGDALPYVPMHQLGLSAGAGTDRWGATALFSYTSALPEEAAAPGEGLQTDAVLNLDLAGSVVMWRTLELWARIDNVTGQRSIVSRRPYGARPSKPLGGMIGVRYSL